MSEQSSPVVEEHHRPGIKDIAGRLYRGEAGVDVVGKRKYFYGVFAAILLIAIITFVARPFNLGIDFKGGNSYTLPASVGTLADVRATFTENGANVASAQEFGNTSKQYLIKTAVLDSDPGIAAKKSAAITDAVASKYKISAAQISETAVSGAWGSQITLRAVWGSVVFLILAVVYLALVLREWRMAVAAMAALLQNLLLTATVYLLLGFEVTPSTVIGFLTILGFALYDVVVVFDKVRENTRGITGSATRTYAEAANLAVNQTLMRSINTAIVALLPVGGLLFIGAGLLGAGTLKDLGLVLFVGMLAAVYSSIFLATPVLVDLKEQEPRIKLHKQRVLQRRAAALVNPERERKAATRSPAASDEDETEKVLAGSTPRAGARPQQPRKRPGASAKPGSRPSGSRSGGRKR